LTFEISKYLPEPEILAEVEASLLRVGMSKSAVRGHELLRAMDGLVPGRLQRAALDTLKEARVLTVVRSSADQGEALYTYDEARARSLFSEEMAAAKVLKTVGYSAIKQEQNVRIVATLPEDWPKIQDIDPTDEAIRRIIIGARRSLWVVSPYFDEFGKAALEKSLLGRAKNEVRIRLIGRQLAPADSDNIRSIKCLQNLVEVFRKERLENQIEIREFTSRNARTGETEAGLHSKIVIADERVCYIGSANMTRWSLSRNFEMGVELTGEMVTPVLMLVEKIWAEAGPFTL
jgi:phosphatidylserine/phosphatidylglycerophosphate/cardiolipin synthase-like enzyme